MKNWIKTKWNRFLLNQLVNYTGIRLDPDPGIWGVIDKQEEEQILAELYKNDLCIALFKKYAEIANKAILSVARTEGDYWKSLGAFLAFNSIILKAKRAYKNAQSRTNPKTQRTSQKD